MAGRVGGKISIAVNGRRLLAKGPSFTWNIGADKREQVVGADEVHGYKEMPQVPFIEGPITVDGGTDVREVIEAVDATVTLELASGQTVVLREAVWAAEGSGTTEEGELPARWEGTTGDISNP